MDKHSPSPAHGSGWVKVVPQRGPTWKEISDRHEEGKEMEENTPEAGLNVVRPRQVVTAQQFLDQIEKRLPRRLPDDPEWCGHSYVDRDTWACADCERPVTAATRARLDAALQETDPEKLWVLLVCDDEGEPNEPPLPEVLAIVHHTAQLPRAVMGAGFCDADDLRRLLKRTTWIQNVFVPQGVTGYDPGDDIMVPPPLNLVYERVPR